MTKEGMDEPPFATEECSPLNQTYDPNTNDPKRKSVQSWYARMSIEKRAEYNAKRRISRQQRKVAALDCASDTCATSMAPICANTPQTHASAGASANKQGGKGWYANLSDEKKAEHLRKLRMAREQKRSAAQQIGASANKQGMVQHTPLGDITNTHTKGTCATSTAPISANTPQTNVLDTCATSTAPISANTPQTHASAGGSANKQGGKGWYATLSDEKKAEHLRNLRMAREQKRSAAPVLDVDVLQSSTRKDQYGSAQSGITRILGTPTGGTNMEEDGSTDWLHTNPTYKRKVRLTDHVAEMDGQDNFHTPSFIFGSSIEPLDASYEKERLRKRTKYLNMDATQKDVMLSRNRAYKKRKRDTNTLFDQNDIADAISGTTDQSSRASAIKMHPSYTNFHRGGCNNEEDSDAHGIFEPMGQTCETEECADTIEEEQTLYDDDGDDECRLYSAQGNEFESYRVMPDGSHAFETHDPYDYVYNNLPTKHHVLKPVKDCVHCGAMRFQYEGPAFCCRKALGVLPLVGSTLDVYLDDHITKLETMRNKAQRTKTKIS